MARHRKHGLPGWTPSAIEAAGLRIEKTDRNPYEFISAQAPNASAEYGVNSISVLAVKAGA